MGGEELGEGNILEDITIIEDDEDEPRAFEQLPAMLTADSVGHYGNPADGCLDDEDVVELAGGKACMPKIDTQDGPDDLPTPKCKFGWGNAGEGNGCPSDADVKPDSRALPMCLDGSTSDPYANGEFHCALACPCETLTADGECSAESHTHCPQGATCQLGET